MPLPLSSPAPRFSSTPTGIVAILFSAPDFLS
jgi:hypothetical protein